MSEIPTEDELRALSLRALAVYVARCVLRVHPLFNCLRGDHPDFLERRRAVADLVQLIVDVASYPWEKGISGSLRQRLVNAHGVSKDPAEPTSPVPLEAQKEVLTADRAASALMACLDASRHASLHSDLGERAAKAVEFAASAAKTAEQAASHAGDGVAFVNAARRDYEVLRRATDGCFPAEGQVIDLLGGELLGSLWQGVGQPGWYLTT